MMRRALAAMLLGTFLVNAASPATGAPGSRVPPPPTFAAALDNDDLYWTTGGIVGWAPERLVFHDGVDAATSGRIYDNQSSFLRTFVTGPTKLRFWWKVDSEVGYDYLNVTVDGIKPFAGISGDVSWQHKTVTVPEGAHEILWTYSKDDSVWNGEDRGWVDQVTTSAK